MRLQDSICQSNAAGLREMLDSSRSMSFRRFWKRIRVWRTILAESRCRGGHSSIVWRRSINRAVFLSGEVAVSPGHQPAEQFEPEFRKDLLGGMIVLRHDGAVYERGSAEKLLYSQYRKESGTRKVPLTLILYYAWANRQATLCRSGICCCGPRLTSSTRTDGAGRALVGAGKILF